MDRLKIRAKTVGLNNLLNKKIKENLFYTPNICYLLPKNKYLFTVISNT